MFYLEHLLNILIKNPFRLIFFVLSSIFLIQVVLNPESLLSFLKIEQEVKSPYFNALVRSDENIEDLARKLRELPSIKRVTTISEKKIFDELNKTLSEITPDSKEGLPEDLKLKGLKVFFKKDASKKAQDLTMEYLGRLIGKEKITLSKVFNQEDLKKLKTNKTLIKKEYLIGGAFALWIMSCLLFVKKFSKYTYLLESYQRARLIKLKLFIALICVFMIPLFIYNFYIFGPPLTKYLMILVLFSCLGVFCMTRKGWAE